MGHWAIDLQSAGLPARFRDLEMTRALPERRGTGRGACGLESERVGRLLRRDGRAANGLAGEQAGTRDC
jgi:hypothetical protein